MDQLSQRDQMQVMQALNEMQMQEMHAQAEVIRPEGTQEEVASAEDCGGMEQSLLQTSLEVCAWCRVANKAVHSCWRLNPNASCFVDGLLPISGTKPLLVQLGTVHELTGVMEKSVETSQMSLVLYLVNWAHLRRSYITKQGPAQEGENNGPPFRSFPPEAHLDLGALLLPLHFLYRCDLSLLALLSLLSLLPVSQASMHYHMTTAAEKSKEGSVKWDASPKALEA
eukprot:Skav222434  [mRNA]  locus=scaffold2883:39517:42987:- [translate_table: standard]